MKRTSLLAAIVILFVAHFMVTSFALAEQEKTEKNWEFNLAPFYIWAVAIEGDLTVGTNTGPLKVPFSDIVDNLEAAFILHFEAMYNNKFGLLVDVNYLDIGSDVTVPIGPGLPAKVDFNTTLGEVSGFYRINRDKHNFDLIAGMRYTILEDNVTSNSGLTLVDVSKDWVDPLIGMRWLWDFADKWKLIVRGDIGGFGVGSDFSWQGAATVDWQPFKYVSFIGGYRAIGQDYKEGSGPTQFRLDATFHGPLLGVNFRW